MPPRPPREYAKVLDAHRRKLARLAERRGVDRLKPLYDRAQQEVVKKIERLPVGMRDSFTAHSQRLVLAQVRQGQAIMAARLAGELGDVSREAQVESLGGLADDLTRLEQRFRGVDVVLPIDEAARFAGVIDRRRPSLLRMHRESMARYGGRVAESMENELALSLVTGETTLEAIDRVQKVAGNEWWQAERIVRSECLSGNTLVDGAVVRAVHRRWYEGPMVEVVTKGGRKFSATPNHPMLTRRGWVAAGSLQQCDDLIRYRGKQGARALSHKDVAARPSTLAEIFDAVSAIGVRERRRTTKPDFHGDGINGEVDIFSSNRELPFGKFAPLDQPLMQLVFPPSDHSRTRFCGCCGHLLGITEQCSLCNPTDVGAGIYKSALDRSVAYVQRLSYVMSRFAGFVPLGNFFGRQVLPSGMLAAACVERVPCGGEGSRNLGVANYFLDPHDSCPHRSGDFAAAKAGDIEFDGVLSVTVRAFCGHVYNLSTPDGYFAINGIYTGNTSWAFNATQADGIQESAAAVPGLMQRWVEFVSDDGTPLDNRVGVDSIAMHGQLATPGGLFTMPPTTRDGQPVSASLVGRTWAHPPNRPNDRAAISPWSKSWGGYGWVWRGGRRVDLSL